MKVMITGGAGFIGSEVIRQMMQDGYQIINIDKLTYAGNLESLKEVSNKKDYVFYRVDIGSAIDIRNILQLHKPDAIMHLAAESHVDRSIENPSAFIDTNIVGTYTLLAEALTYWENLEGEKQEKFRFQHISTDEVYGSLGESGQFTEDTAYRPNSPYSASKAASDHLVRAWHQTYGLPVITTNCSNNYGPYQFPEKLIPRMILNAIHGKSLPLYGNGLHIRDWLYVSDHARALITVLRRGRVGETYNVGGMCELSNQDVVTKITNILDAKFPALNNQNYSSLIQYVADRKGHDFRYSIDCGKITKELGWTPKEDFESGILKTIDWYLRNEKWWRPILDGQHIPDSF